MPINPSIALGLQVPDVAGAFVNGQKLHDERRKQKTLADLLPRAAHGDRTAIDQLWAVDPNIAARMDDRQREQAHAMTQDLSAAVRWADTPEKWQYVQQHYSQKGIDLSPYRFEDRERGLVALDQIGGYLKGDGNPTNLQREYEFLNQKDPSLADKFLHNKAEGAPLVANNGDGTFTIIPRGFSGQQPPPEDEVTATGPNGQKLRLNKQTNQWEPMGGPSPGGSGGFL